jgi:hypothetical protein
MPQDMETFQNLLIQTTEPFFISAKLCTRQIREVLYKCLIKNNYFNCLILNKRKICKIVFT